MTDRDGFPYFVDAVSRRSGLPPEQAAALARAVLRTLAERVTDGASDDLASHLPNEVDGYLRGPAPEPTHPTGPAPNRAGAVGTTLEPAVTDGPDDGVDGLNTGVRLEVGDAAAVAPPPDPGPAEFLRRVGERAGVDPATARAGTGAVFGTLRSAMTVREFRQLVSRLPREDGGSAAGRHLP
ncbi:DUF2267 domain-containing protein [Micromonospora sp. NPDC049047]|uniref:DUF2267 domain-containing protein n=1 Tax=Micromonospora sp. NPDC049047 TaxID=3155645 RepID=UPI0033CD9C4C